MTDDNRRVALSKVQRGTPTGQELIALLTDLTADGQVTRDEVAQLRQWLEVRRDVDLPACAFLYEAIDDIAQDGEISEAELDGLAEAIERVLPPEVRKAAAAQRRDRRLARRATAEAARQEARTAQREARELARPLHRADFVVVGVRFSEERQSACESLDVGEAVTLEREPDNVHDDNAILVMSSDDCELGYVPREHASQMAPLLDDGAEVQARIKKLLESSQGLAIPVIVATLYRGGGLPAEAPPAPRPQQTETPSSDRVPVVLSARPARGPALAAYALVVAILIGLALLME